MFICCCCCWRDLLIPNYLSLGIIRGVNLAHHRQVGSLAAGLSRLSRRPNFYGLASSPQAKVALLVQASHCTAYTYSTELTARVSFCTI